MDSSSGFGSTPCDWTLISNSLSLRLPYSVKLATECKSLTHYAKGTQSPRRAPTVCMHAVSGSISLPSRGSFHLSLTVLCAIGHQFVFRLGRWSSRLPTGFLVSCGTLVSARRLTFSRKGLLPSLAGLSNPLLLRSSVLFADPQPRRASPSVWPLSRSLAAT